MKPLTITLLALSLLTACSKNRTYRQKGQIIEIANWRFDKSAVPLAGIRVCVMDYHTQDNFLAGSIVPSGSYNCGVTDADGKFDISLTVPRKEYRKNSFLTYIPQQSGVIIDRDYSSEQGNGEISKKLKCFTLGVYKEYPAVVTFNNVNYLNNRDSLYLTGIGIPDIYLMGKQTNTKIRGFLGTKSYTNPTVVGGGFAYSIYRNGKYIDLINFDDKVTLQGDTGYYTINY
ncbi:MAG: hypothetical protein ABL940_06630 [Bacteroidia bacterium]